LSWKLGVELRARQSPDWRCARRHSGEWRSRDRPHAALKIPRRNWNNLGSEREAALVQTPHHALKKVASDKIASGSPARTGRVLRLHPRGVKGLRINIQRKSACPSGRGEPAPKCPATLISCHDASLHRQILICGGTCVMPMPLRRLPCPAQESVSNLPLNLSLRLTIIPERCNHLTT
jgi:hypothetical protein